MMQNVGVRSLVVCGSPRLSGVSARYADQLAEAFESEGRSVAQWRLARKNVAGCIGCEGCRKDFFCIIEDDMQELYGLIDQADEIHLVCPVYFSGPPGQFKCVLDRLQPYWERRIGPCARHNRESEVKRPVVLHVIGAGGDPFGYNPLVTIVKSAFGSAGFFVADVVDRIGWGQGFAEEGKMLFSSKKS